jgi:HD-GYP domain-containing protein (c-di-GMP phosphodiesterase class II)
MIADRPYRAGMALDAAREELERCSDSQFDGAVVHAFLEPLQEPDLLGVPELASAAAAESTF